MLYFISENSTPNYIALSTDISDSKITGASMIGKTVYTTDDQKWYIISGSELTLEIYVGSGGGSATGATNILMAQIYS